MNYVLIDPVISAWAAENQLHVCTMYKDTEVRSVDVVSKTGKKFQIWIDAPHGTQIAVHAWDYKKQRQDWSGSVSELLNYLREAMETVKSWTQTAG